MLTTEGCKRICCAGAYADFRTDSKVQSDPQTLLSQLCKALTTDYCTSE